MENPKISMETAAKVIGNTLVIAAYADARLLLKLLKELKNIPNGVESFEVNDSKLGYIHLEMMHFYIHLTNRFAFQYLGDPKRHHFFNIFLDEVYKNHLEGCKATTDELDDATIHRFFNEIHKQRQAEYGAYRFYSKKDEGLKGDLFWEFESKLAEILGYKNDSSVKFDIHIALMPLINKHHEFVKNIISETEESKKYKKEK